MTQKKLTATGTDWKALVSEDADLMRAVVRQVMQEILEAEMTDALGAEPGERTEPAWATGPATTPAPS